MIAEIFTFSYSRQAAVLAIIVCSVALEGCSDLYAPYSIRSGFQTLAESSDNQKQNQIVMWSNNAQVEQAILQWLEKVQGGEASNTRLQQAFTEQRRVLPLLPQDAEILQLARRIGADDAIIAEITIKPAVGDERFYTYVAVRDFVVETRTMRWSGTAHCSQPVKDAEKVVIPLARMAVGIGTGQSTEETLIQEGIHICRE